MTKRMTKGQWARGPVALNSEQFKAPSRDWLAWSAGRMLHGITLPAGPSPAPNQNRPKPLNPVFRVVQRGSWWFRVVQGGSEWQKVLQKFRDLFTGASL